MAGVLFPIDWSHYEHIVLDFGGVLYGIDHQLTHRAFQALGAKGMHNDFRHGEQAALFDDLEQGSVHEDAFLETLAARCASGTTKEAVRAAWNAMLVGLHGDAIPWLNSLVPHFDLILFSNTNGLHAAHFEQEILNSAERKFSGCFRDIVYSHRLGVRKPDVEAYHAVADRCSLNPERTLFIDDTMANVEGAIEAGWSAVHFDTTAYSLKSFLRGVGYEDFLHA